MIKVITDFKQPVIFPSNHTVSISDGHLLVYEGKVLRGAFSSGNWRHFTTEEAKNAKT